MNIKISFDNRFQLSFLQVNLGYCLSCCHFFRIFQNVENQNNIELSHGKAQIYIDNSLYSAGCFILLFKFCSPALCYKIPEGAIDESYGNCSEIRYFEAIKTASLHFGSSTTVFYHYYQLGILV